MLTKTFITVAISELLFWDCGFSLLRCSVQRLTLFLFHQQTCVLVRCWFTALKAADLTALGKKTSWKEAWRVEAACEMCPGEGCGQSTWRDRFTANIDVNISVKLSERQKKTSSTDFFFKSNLDIYADITVVL